MKTVDIVPNFVVDRNMTGDKNGISIVNYDKIKEMYCGDDAYFIITSPRFEQEIHNSIRENIDEENIFCFECELYYSYIHDISQYRMWLKENEKKFDKLNEMLCDNKSKVVLENVIKGRITGRFDYFKKVYEGNQYFANDIVNLSTEEIFLDVGAYIGDTVNQIVKITDGKYKKIYCFEPDADAYDILIKNTEKFHNIVLIKKGAWDKEEIMYLQDDSAHGASKIVDEGACSINLCRIDDCVSYNDKITHVKMDIEGAELKALYGATEIIKRCKPLLAICLYHRNEDFLDIPNYIKGLVPEYKLYIRHHNISGTETVLYACT